MPMISLSILGAIASMSSVVRAPSMCSRTMPALIGALARLAPHRELERGSLSPSSIGSLLRFGLPALNPLRFGCCGQAHERQDGPYARPGAHLDQRRPGV